jgi:hypothetical protein
LRLHFCGVSRRAIHPLHEAPQRHRHESDRDEYDELKP